MPYSIENRQLCGDDTLPAKIERPHNPKAALEVGELRLGRNDAIIVRDLRRLMWLSLLYRSCGQPKKT